MLRTERIGRGHADLERILALYERAFPENERRPLDALIDDETGVGELLALYDGALFCGFACLLNWTDISHIIYIAVDEPLRGRGYGAQALEVLYALRPGCRLIADLEADDPAAPNGPQRARRLGLYMRQGFSESSVRYTWRGERYVILSRGGDITPDEFSAFWQNIDRINPAMAQY